MKLCVQHEDGTVETITLTGEWRVTEGKFLNRVTDSSGFEHFFTHDGHYDGWGGSVRQPLETADEIIEAMEGKRRFEKAR